MCSIAAKWHPPNGLQPRRRIRAALQASPAKIPAARPPSPPTPAELQTLRSTWAHRAWVTAGSTAVAAALTKSLAAALQSGHLLEPAAASVAGYLLSDLGSGVFHWAIDNYGDASTPLFGSQIEAFQGHHRWPWTITRRDFANNLHSLGRVIAFSLLPIDIIVNNDVALAFAGVFAGCVMYSQQFHAWAHGTKSKLPAAVVALQDAGLLISRRQHGAHHAPPYNNNYCIVSGVWNEFLDEKKVFEAAEMVIFFKYGVRPRSWSEPDLKWMEEER